MMDGKTIRNKLVGSEEERAVSPVIGVILMVAITVILAAVIATLVMDFGDSTEAPINAQTDADVESDGVTISVVDPGSAEGFILRGPGIDDETTISKNYGTQNPDNWLASSGSSSNLSASTGAATSLTTTDSDYGISSTPWAPDGGTVNIIAIDGDQEEQAGSFEVPDGGW